jgi:glycosyltransferase involved in cell wall biosynthesis
VTTTLRVVVDDILAPSSDEIRRYTEELTRQLIRTAPEACEVSGVVSALRERDYNEILARLPGIADLTKSALSRRELHLSWQLGTSRLPGGGMVHSTSLLAPLAKHDRVNHPGDQTVVTIHDVRPWTHPQGMAPHDVSWQKAMAKRAYRFADAVVVPTHSIAGQLDEIMHYGERIRVIGGAVSSTLTLPLEADLRAEALALPDRYILTVGSLEERKALAPLIRSLASPADAGLPLLVVGPTMAKDDIAVMKLAADAGLPAGRVRSLGHLADTDLAIALDRATVFAYPSLAEGFGLPIIEAFHFGTPVVLSDDPALVEVAAGAGVVVPIAGKDEYSDRLAEAIAYVVGDPKRLERMHYAGFDRAAAFSWRDAAQRVWQLHADL